MPVGRTPQRGKEKEGETEDKDILDIEKEKESVEKEQPPPKGPEVPPEQPGTSKAQRQSDEARDLAQEMLDVALEEQRKEQEEEMVDKELAQIQKKISELQVLRDKALAKKGLRPSPANTEQAKKNLDMEILQKLYNMKRDPEEKDEGSVVMVAQSFNIFGKSDLQKIKDKLAKAISDGNLALTKHSEEKEYLKSTRNFISSAMKFAQDTADKVDDDVPSDEASVISAAMEECDQMQKKIDRVLSQLEKLKEEKSNQKRPEKPTFDPRFPSRWLDFHKAFCEMFRHTNQISKVETYKSCMTGPNKNEVLHLLAGISDDFKEVTDTMTARFGDLEKVLPTERKKIEDLKEPKSDVHEEKNLLVIIEFINLLKSHDELKHLDLSLKYIILGRIREHHKHDLMNREPKDTEDYIRRLKKYLSDVHTINQISGASMKNEENEANGGARKKNGSAEVKTFRASVSEVKKRTCWLCNSPGHGVGRCNLLKGKNVEQIKALFKERKLCPICIRKLDGHHKTNCNEFYSKNGKKMTKSCRCGSGLNYFLCCYRVDPTGLPTVGSSSTRTPPVADSNTTSLEQGAGREVPIILNNGCKLGSAICNSQVLEVKVPGREETVQILAIFDTHSQACLFSPALKKYMKNFRRAVYGVRGVNNLTHFDGGVGELTFHSDGRDFVVKGLVKEIANKSVQQAHFKIPEIWREEYGLRQTESTAHGALSVIFGADALEYFPRELARHRGVRLEKSFFGGELLLSGYAADMSGGASEDDTVEVNRVTLHPIDQKFLDLMNPAQRLAEQKLCPKHRGQPDCPDCKFSLFSKTRMEKVEEDILESGLEFKEGKWIVEGKYKDVEKVPTYEAESLAFMEKLAKRLKVIPGGVNIAESMDRSVAENVKTGIWKYEEDRIKEGNKKYQEYQIVVSPLNYALKPDSQTTKTRVVHNLSFSSRGRPSFNSVQFTGTSGNYKIHHILLRMRGFLHLAINDIKKFYNRIFVSPRDSRLQTFLWKRDGLLSDGKFERISSDVLLFGCRHSQFLANRAKLKTSELFIEPVCPSAHEDICYSYTDDLVVSSNQSREHLEQKMEIVEKGLKEGNFELKTWKKSGDPDEDDLEVNMAGDSPVLGIFYRASTDSWKIKTCVNFSKKIRNLRSPAAQILTREDLREHIEKNGLTKRDCLAAVHFCYDPLLLNLKVKALLSQLYRRLIIKEPQLEYSQRIPGELLPEWEKAIGYLLDIRDRDVTRCVLPACYDSESKVQLILFCDGGETSSVARAYVRVTRKAGGHSVVNLVNSFRLGDLTSHTAPRTEVGGVLLAARLIDLIVSVLGHLKFEKIFLLTDSRVALGALSSFTAKMKLYYFSRIEECQKVIEAHDVGVYHIEGSLNVADEGTKIRIEDNPRETERFPHFLEEDESSWPVKKHCYESIDVRVLMNPKMLGTEDISPDEVHVNRVICDSFINNILEKHSFRRALGIIQCWFLWKKKHRGDFLQAETEAQELLFSLAKPDDKQISGLRRQYKIEVVHNVNNAEEVYLISRPYQFDNRILQTKLRLLSGRTKIGRRILDDYHIHCCSTDRELAALHAAGLFLTDARNYLKKLQKTCKTCLRIRRTQMEASMGTSYQISASQYPPYFRSFGDLVGPIKVKVAPRKIRKCWILGITCCWTRHVSLQLLTSLSADCFLAGLLTISALNGSALPRFLHFDWGRNVVALRRVENENQTENEEQDERSLNRRLTTTLRANRISLVFSAPHSPWRQSQIEVINRLLKLNMRRSNIYKQTYDISRWGMILARQSEMLNNRPLSVKFIQENLIVLTPNKLIYGQRNQLYPEDLDMNLNNNQLYYEMSKLETFLEEWKKNWSKSYLIEVQKFLKWRNPGGKKPKVGSVVFILDHQNKISRSPTLGQVTEVLSERTLKVRYVKKEAVVDKNWQIVRPAVCAILTRPVQGLVWLADPDEGDTITLDPTGPVDEPDAAGGDEAAQLTGEEKDENPPPLADEGLTDGEVLNDNENRDDNEARDEPNELNPDDPGVESVGNEPVNVVPELPLIGRRQRKKVKRYGFD